MHLFIGFITLAGFVFLSSLLIYDLATRKRRNIRDRLMGIAQRDDEKEGEDIEPLNAPFIERAIIPVFTKIGGLFARLTPGNIKKNIEEKMWQAGYTEKNRVSKFFTIQSIWLISLPSIVGMFLYLMELPRTRILVLVILTAIFAMLFPSVRLNSRIIARRERIKKDLPNAIDLLVVSVEAGLAFDMAVEKVIEKISGPLAQEFGYTLNEIRMGKSRGDAFKELGERTKMDELASFIGAVIQADQLGVSVGSILRIQSDTIRVRRRQFIEEVSMKAPIKMLFPLIFFIFPAIFVVVLGPAVINIIKVFAGME